MMSGPAMADFIRSTMEFPIPVSTQLIGWASAVVAEITDNAIVNHALVTGTCPPGGPLSAGAAIGGIITGLDPSRLATAVAAAAGYPSVSANLTAYCAQITTHIMTLGLVSFDSGSITGTCTNTAVSPGPLTGGAGSGGYIIGLSPALLATAIHGACGYPGGPSPELNKFCEAIVNHILDNAEVEYASGSVTGTCPTGGGSLAGGAAAAGTVS